MIRIGVLGPSEIAGRRFIPGVQSSDRIEYKGIAYPNRGDRLLHPGTDTVPETNELEKAKRFHQKFGGELFEGYESLICSDRVDAGRTTASDVALLLG